MHLDTKVIDGVEYIQLKVFNDIIKQSNEIIDHIHSLFPNKKCYLYQNISEKRNHIVDLDNYEVKLFHFLQLLL